MVQCFGSTQAERDFFDETFGDLTLIPVSPSELARSISARPRLALITNLPKAGRPMWVCARKTIFCNGAATPGLNKVGGIMIRADPAQPGLRPPRQPADGARLHRRQRARPRPAARRGRRGEDQLLRHFPRGDLHQHVSGPGPGGRPSSLSDLATGATA